MEIVVDLNLNLEMKKRGYDSRSGMLEMNHRRSKKS